jgi:hypothetical protein
VRKDYVRWQQQEEPGSSEGGLLRATELEAALVPWEEAEEGSSQFAVHKEMRPEEGEARLRLAGQRKEK